MEDALDDDELTDWNNEQGLDKLKEKMKDLEEQVEIDMEKDESITDEVEQLIQQFLTVRCIASGLILLMLKFYSLLERWSLNWVMVRSSSGAR